MSIDGPTRSRRLIDIAKLAAVMVHGLGSSDRTRPIPTYGGVQIVIQQLRKAVGLLDTLSSGRLWCRGLRNTQISSETSGATPSNLREFGNNQIFMGLCTSQNRLFFCFPKTVPEVPFLTARSSSRLLGRWATRQSLSVLTALLNVLELTTATE